MVRVAKIEAERDELSANLSSANAQLRALADEVGEFSAKIAKQVEELNTVIRQKWEIEGQLERCAKSVKALVRERDTLIAEMIDRNVEHARRSMP
jgi:septal ring factor EnvC (AmiA/AmiB activator)